MGRDCTKLGLSLMAVEEWEISEGTGRTQSHGLPKQALRSMKVGVVGTGCQLPRTMNFQSLLPL